MIPINPRFVSVIPRRPGVPKLIIIFWVIINWTVPGVIYHLITRFKILFIPTLGDGCLIVLFHRDRDTHNLLNILLFPLFLLVWSQIPEMTLTEDVLIRS